MRSLPVCGKPEHGISAEQNAVEVAAQMRRDTTLEFVEVECRGDISRSRRRKEAITGETDLVKDRRELVLSEVSTEWVVRSVEVQRLQKLFSSIKHFENTLVSRTTVMDGIIRWWIKHGEIEANVVSWEEAKALAGSDCNFANRVARKVQVIRRVSVKKKGLRHG